MRLGQETLGRYTAFDIQLRRRLLFAIGILDTHSALDRGTIPILPSSAFPTPPLNINDEEMSPPDNVPSMSSLQLTDMSHASMTYQAMICQRKLYELARVRDNNWDNWPARIELIAAFERYVKHESLAMSESRAPLHRLQHISGQKILASLQLLARRPPYHLPHNAVPPWDDFDVLEAATGVLEQHLQPMPPELQPWAWKNWVQWHALAVVLAELLVRPRNSLSDRAFTVATHSFRHYAHIVADSESGLLWKPIARLMRRVQSLRRNTHTELAPMEPIGHGTLNGAPYDSMAVEDPNIQENVDMFDFSQWELDGEATHARLFNELPADVKDCLDFPQDYTPHLAWDTFLQEF